jgi:predicted nuclease of predicted toxin-antitoxin system
VKWVADENVDQQVVHMLRYRGHEVWSVAEQAGGISDDEVLAVARERAAIVVTSDKDFGELVYRRRLATAGVVLLRLPGLGAMARAQRLQDVLDEVSDLAGSFVVIDPSGVRIRRT